jgi:DNA (cytosine-5)-methyltransferase 1
VRAPRILDLYCGEGGAGAGYARAGFEVVGVDVNPNAGKRYPFEFYAGDALEFVREHGRSFDAIHASPPCQRYSHATVAGHADKHPDLVGATREALLEVGRPFVIENVPRSPLLDPITLCGSQFGRMALDTDGDIVWLQRHRLFESSEPIDAPRRHHHPRGVQWAGVYGGARRDKHEARHVRHGGYVPAKDVQQRLMGIDWPVTQKGLYESIPPAYTEWIGRQLVEFLVL